MNTLSPHNKWDFDTLVGGHVARGVVLFRAASAAALESSMNAVAWNWHVEEPRDAARVECSGACTTGC